MKLSNLLSFAVLPTLLLSHPTPKPNTSPNPSHEVTTALQPRADGDIARIEWGDGWCVTVPKIFAYSRILWRLFQNIATDFENSGYVYARGKGGKWTVEIKRADTGYSALEYIIPAWRRLKSQNTIRSGEVYAVGEHMISSIGQHGGDGSQGARIEIWITTITNWAPEFYQILKRDGGEVEEVKKGNWTDYGDFKVPNFNPDDEYLEKHVWKGPGKAITEPPKDSKKKDGGKVEKRQNPPKYWDACPADDNNHQYYNRPVDTSVADCMWLDRTNQYWSEEKASFPLLFATFSCDVVCCRGRCNRSWNGCCPMNAVTC